MLNTEKIYQQIITSLFKLQMEGAKAITSKRSMDEDESIIKKRKFDNGSFSTIKHYIGDKANWDLRTDQIQSLFKTCRIMVLDNEVDKNNVVTPHYHILGEAKVSQRKMRDWSLNNIRAADIKGGLEAKGFYLTCRVKNIENLKHYNNTIEYLKRKNNTIIEDESVQFQTMANPLWRMLDDAEEPAKFNVVDMAEFRRRFPLINGWHSQVAKLKLSKWSSKILEEMEQQRKHEDRIRDITIEEKHLVMPNMSILNHAKDFRDMLINHDKNSGVCLILCGGALMCKSTINRIIAESFGDYAVWPGSQWICKDNLKFDSAARQGINTIVVEEMQWIDLQHRITLEKTINSIKEQLTGAGLDVRLAKTKSTLVDDIKLKINYLLISMNESEYVNYKVLANMINSKPEFRRRFVIINMDDPKYADIAVCRTRVDNNWIGQEQK